ncbi:putative ABC-type ATPase [Chitinophaga niastensis]|uniref:Putative ABC-type ATPase n=1 Tax=Chitinophaga niastensis TaxID=536980 RepID=A0A2P8HSY8_CHINA|nr:putative ABC-type ATPase [Chitinophaga niastensis]
MRIIGGPNGSGKSTLFTSLRQEINEITGKPIRVGYFINADNLEKDLQEKRFLNFEDYQLSIVPNQWEAFLNKSSFFAKINMSLFKDAVSVKNNLLQLLTPYDVPGGYIGALIADFLRNQLLLSGQTYSFETVMSHPSKLDEIKHAKTLGYKTYLYFIATTTPAINISRVKNRISKAGHAVPEKSIISRYPKSLDNLAGATALVDKAYFFDNSNDLKMIATKEGEDLNILQEQLPQWFIENVIHKFFP